MYKSETIGSKERQLSQQNVDDELCKYLKKTKEILNLFLHDNEVSVCSNL